VGPVLEIDRIVKDYRGLRPLRIESLALGEGERVSLSGLDAVASEVLTNLVTGAALPDRGEIRVFGRSTAELSSGEEWLSWLDRFGILTERAVMLDALPVSQNLAIPFTLQIETPPPEVVAAVDGLAREVGLAAAWLDCRLAETPPDVQARVRLARAIALGPAILLLDHPTASVPRAAVRALAADVVRLAGARGLTALAVTEDSTFASALGGRRLRLNAASGALTRDR
jgi:ABC-type transporter Mla maintaining outer membrane lipid asymmetry ATPase subunit MlaF